VSTLEQAEVRKAIQLGVAPREKRKKEKEE